MAVHVGSWQMKRAFDTCPMPHKSYVSLVLTIVTNEDKLREDKKKSQYLYIIFRLKSNARIDVLEINRVWKRKLDFGRKLLS